MRGKLEFTILRNHLALPDAVFFVLADGVW